MDLEGDSSRFVAVGADAEGRATSWTSTDGVTWEQHDVPERSFGQIPDGPDLIGRMGQLVRLGDTLYSFGAMNFMDAWQGAAWRWTDGGEWEVIESSSAVFLGRPEVVTASDDALLAGIVSFEGGLRGTYSTWLWTPASSWVKTALSSSGEADLWVDVMAWAGGTFLALGSSARPVEGVEVWDWPRTLAAWSSPDGLDWTAVQPPPDMTVACSLTPVGDSFAVLGTADDLPAAWVLDGGLAWQPGSVEPPSGPEIRASDLTVTPCATATVGTAFLAAGANPTEGGTLLWTSPDGRHWVFIERLDVTSHYPAAVGDLVLMLGSEGDPNSEGGARRFLLRGTVDSP